jgi:hypothetical protein
MKPEQKIGYMVLNTIDIVLPDIDDDFFDRLTEFLSVFGVKAGNSIRFITSNPNYLPVLGLSCGPIDTPEVVFDKKRVKIQNTTGVERDNPFSYIPLSLGEVTKGLIDHPLNVLDHIGFNLPYFDGVHPEILELRTELKTSCLYHLFPSGEPWDFVIPGTKEEVNGTTINYSVIRKPKFEIVSFSNCSKPLIQIDFSVKASYPDIVSMFPEGLHDDNLHNVWVYIQNPYGIDICFVVNEPIEGDWSEYFAESRIT